MKNFKDNITANGIKSKLKQKDIDVIYFDSIGSTNSYLKELAIKGAKVNTVVIADSQAIGRGRFERKFHSPSGNGIYMSILLKPQLPASHSVLITSAAAVAVCKAIETLSEKSPQIKWVNDILIENKKVCGILTEGSINPENGYFNWAVLGIGINVYPPSDGFNDEIKNIAGAVFETFENGLRNRLAAQIINCFYEIYEKLSEKSFLREYKEHLICLGKNINVIRNNVSRPALALDIDDECRLLVEFQDKTQEYLSSGEISIKL